MIIGTTKRPRNVDTPRAAAILYGDWGTSKAYVIGLAFAVAGYASFWLIAAMCLLTALVGINYMAICRHYPDGGGVYASVRHRSEIISIVGAFLLIADYIVTAALSALSAFQYLQGITIPSIWAAAAIAVIGALNFLRPQTYRRPRRSSFPSPPPSSSSCWAFSPSRTSARPCRHLQPLTRRLRGRTGAASSASSSPSPASKPSPTPPAS